MRKRLFFNLKKGIYPILHFDRLLEYKTIILTVKKNNT